MLHLNFFLLSILNTALLRSVQSLKKNKYDAEPMLRSCGISINSNFIQVEGRVLPAPKVLLANYSLFSWRAMLFYIYLTT